MIKTPSLLLLLTSMIFAQTTSNPDFTIIGQLLLQSNETATTVTGADIELAVTGYVNPYARAEVYLHKHDVESALELEEAVLTMERGLPLGLAARLGRLRPDFGKLNREHAHQWPFITAPDAATSFTGPELWSGTGAEFSVLMPLPWYAQLSVGAFANGMSAEAHVHDDAHAEEEAVAYQSYSGRLGNFIELGSFTHLELGTSYFATPETEATIIAIDSKLKWRPDTYRGFTLQGEFIKSLHEDQQEDELVETAEMSFYTYANYQFDRKWNVGAMLDGVKHHGEDMQYTPSLFFGLSPVEESMVFRIVLKNEAHEGSQEPLLLTQLIWSLGPHKPHKF
jgi:hypothetical protein